MTTPTNNDPSTTVLRFNNNKPRFSQIPWKYLTALARHFQVGGIKYFRTNWRKPVKSLFELRDLVFDSFLRHAVDLQDAFEEYERTGDVEQFKKDLTDPELGLDYLCHLQWNAIVIRYHLVKLGIVALDPGEPWLQIPDWEEKVKAWEARKKGTK